MHQIEIVYEGRLRTRSTLLQPGVSIITYPPTDNNGRGKYFIPTDLPVL